MTTTTLPLATRAEFDAALPPVPTTGAVADATHIYDTLRTERRRITLELNRLDGDDTADIHDLLDAIRNGDTPADHPATDHSQRLQLEHEARRIDRALNLAQHRLAEARQRDQHWQDHQARCSRWLERWGVAHRQRPTSGSITDQADDAPNVRAFLLTTLAAELAASRPV